eukprot:1187812-Prorocentrum_minimum.AAC.4
MLRVADTDRVPRFMQVRLSSSSGSRKLLARSGGKQGGPQGEAAGEGGRNGDMFLGYFLNELKNLRAQVEVCRFPRRFQISICGCVMDGRAQFRPAPC